MWHRWTKPAMLLSIFQRQSNQSTGIESHIILHKVGFIIATTAHHLINKLKWFCHESMRVPGLVYTAIWWTLEAVQTFKQFRDMTLPVSFHVYTGSKYVFRVWNSSLVHSVHIKNQLIRVQLSPWGYKRKKHPNELKYHNSNKCCMCLEEHNGPVFTFLSEPHMCSLASDGPTADKTGLGKEMPFSYSCQCSALRTKLKDWMQRRWFRLK